MITISLCMIVRNEEEGLARCLLSVKDIVDEINIVDTGSTDRTKEIAAAFTDRIFDFVWIDDFAAARNFSFSKATKKYIIWLDADDHLEEKDRMLFKKLKKTLALDVDSVTMPYYLAFDQTGKVTSSLRRNRLVRREANFQWIGPVHEYLAVYGKIVNAEAGVTHKKNKTYTDRNLQIYLKREQEGEVFSPRDQYYYANELRDHNKNEQAILYYEKFLDGQQGWIEDNIHACMKLAECYGRLGNKEKQMNAWCRSLVYDKPRAEFCYQMGGWFFEAKQYERAIFWYELATNNREGEQGLALYNQAFSTWLPLLQLCLCYDRLKQYEKANEHNELALLYQAGHPSMLYNRNYFQKILGITGE